MPEGMTPEIAQTLSERGASDGDSGEGNERRKHRWEEVAEVVEVLFLAVVAITTAWSGYQASQWDGQQALLYGEATEMRIDAEAADTLGGQVLGADASFLNGWLEAEAAGDRPELAAIFIRRFSPEYRIAFDDWLETDPLHDVDAPPGPGHMPSYRNPLFEKAKALNAKASVTFDQGTDAAHVGDTYVRYTVLFASALFFISVASRFRVRRIRLATLVLVSVLLAYSVIEVVGLPRL